MSNVINILNLTVRELSMLGDILDDSSIILKQRGWCQKVLENETGKLCIMGAIREATRNQGMLDTEGRHYGGKATAILHYIKGNFFKGRLTTDQLKKAKACKFISIINDYVVNTEILAIDFLQAGAKVAYDFSDELEDTGKLCLN